MKMKNLKYCLVRCEKSGLFVGKLKKMKRTRAILVDSINLWRWSGACGVSQIAVDGVSNPEKCLFTVPVEKRILTDVIEVIPMTKKAVESILNVQSWKK